MKHIIFYLILTFCSVYSFAQESFKENNFNFEFRKVKKNSKLFETNYANYSIKIPKDQKKIQVRFKIKAKSGKKSDFDPNKFYLLAPNYKLRLRPVDMKYTWGARMMYVGFDILIHEKQDEIPYLTYNPEIPDTFQDYTVADYTDYSPSFNFGKKWDPIYFTPYRGHAKIRNTKIDIYFSVPKDLSKGIIYYGNEKVAEFNL